ncbi:MAG: hypothetical protein IJ649_00500 [Oscillospiraceae bacterium]|nr:hypothetical protein [Oscillospiraceae bacterium]
MELRQRDERKGELSFKSGGTVRMDQYIARAEIAAAQAAESAAAAASQLAQVEANTDAIAALRRDVDSIGEELPGKYTKPFEGIPETDLSADVQASLGRADTALQPDALSAYRTAAAQDVIDGGKQAKLVSGGNIKTVNGQTILGAGDLAFQYSRPNLLDNWYFAGGGSQKGNGIFPINQRGQTTYTGSNTVDRWASMGLTQVVINSDSIRLTSNQVWTRLQQKINSPENLVGCTVTLSILYKAATGTPRIGLYNETKGIIFGTGTLSQSTALTCSSSSFFVDSSKISQNDKVHFMIYPSSGSETGKSLDVAAVKLEIGDTQTLAHQENGTWVLNEVPDYGEQLRRCQRYYIKFDRYITSGFLTSAGKLYQIPVYLPISMAGTPKVTMSGYVARTSSGYSARTGNNWTLPESLTVQSFHNLVQLSDTVASAVDTNNIQLSYYITDLVLEV